MPAADPAALLECRRLTRVGPTELLEVLVGTTLQGNAAMKTCPQADERR